MTNHAHDHPVNNPKIAIGFFCVFIVITFLYLRFYATYSSNNAYVTSQTSNIQNDGLIISPVAPRYAAFSSPDDKVVFEYPIEWFISQKSETLWEITDLDATTEAALKMIVEVKEASGSAETLIGCGKCEKVSISNTEFAKKKDTDTEDKVTYSVATVLEQKGYSISAIYPNAAAELTAQVQQVFDSIIVQD
jgi:hypothetical protein